MEELMYTLQLKEESENTEVIVNGSSQHGKSSSQKLTACIRKKGDQGGETDQDMPAKEETL